MADAIDVFADAVHINVMAFGCTLQFAVSKPVPMAPPLPAPPAPTPLPADRVATIRLTPELLKGLAFLLREQVLQYERNAHLKIEIPPELMGGLLAGTGRERWDRFWE